MYFDVGGVVMSLKTVDKNEGQKSGTWLIENFARELHIIYFTVRANTITVGKGVQKKFVPLITDIGQAIDWVKGTFFFARVRKKQGKSGKEQLDADLLHQKCLGALENLESAGIIKLLADVDGMTLLPGCHVMSKHTTRVGVGARVRTSIFSK